MPAKEVKKFLDDNKIKYVSVKHSQAYSTEEIAAMTAVRAEEFAKSIIIWERRTSIFILWMMRWQGSGQEFNLSSALSGNLKRDSSSIVPQFEWKLPATFAVGAAVKSER